VPFVEIDGREIHYQDQGHGEAVIFLHHGFASSSMWETMTSEVLSWGYRVICYDRYGYGLSRPGPDFWDFYLDSDFRPAMVRELEGLVKVLGLEQFHLVGQCEGGVVAVDYAGAYPQKTASLAFSSTQCFSETDMRTFSTSKFPSSFSDLDPALQKKLYKWHGEQRAKEFYEHASVCGGAYGVGFFDLRPALAKVKADSLIIYPDRSKLFQVEQGLALYRGLPSGQLAVLPGCGHNTYEQRPRQYLELLKDFWRGLEKNKSQA
jgi:pimeloyl-ACP methyl ester carboxylesterase